jgi:hypothetical protein
MPFDTPPAIVQEHIGAAPYVVAVGGQVADVWSTIYAKERGLVEGNPVVGQGNARLIIAKGAAAGVTVLVMRLLDKRGDDKAAKWVGYIFGAAMSGVAVRNTIKARRHGQ